MSNSSTDPNQPAVFSAVSCSANNPGSPRHTAPQAEPPLPQAAPCLGLEPELNDQLNKTIGQAVAWMRTQQHEDGHWVGFLKTNSSIEAEWVMAMYLLGITDDPKYANVVKTIINEQREDGSWEVYFNAPNGDISATVESYTALRIAGYAVDHPAMIKARKWIFERGGLSKVRVFTKFWLAMLGEWPWEGTPSLPPETIYLPKWFPINLYTFGSWGRATIVALCLVSCQRPVKKLPENMRLDELFPQGRRAMDYSLPPAKTGIGNFFSIVDKFLSLYTKSPLCPGRDSAIRLCIEWIVRRQEADGCWAGIQPPWIYALLGLHAQGYAVSHPVIQAGLKAFNEPWAFTNEKGTYLQCCTSPVWDTVLSLVALNNCGLTGQDEAVQKAINYTLSQQITAAGDWQVNCPRVPSGGWAFEYENDCYPDVDDSAVAVQALQMMREGAPNQEAITKAATLGMKWIQGLRSDNWAWGAFDKNNNNALICHIPFCDFGEVLDPPSADVTAHVIEAFSYMGQTRHNNFSVRKAIEYLRTEQEAEGCWFGRWGVNYIYGTGLVLPALKAACENMDSDYVHRAAKWLVSKQNTDGGWGETCASYMDRSMRGVGTSTASQTGWALMGLLAVNGHEYDQAIKKGVQYLLNTCKDGQWTQKEYTGTGFPGYGIGEKTDVEAGATLDQGKELSRGFMLNYHMYCQYFAMMALGRARRHFND